MYDFLIVGAGLFGAVCAHELTAAGRSVLVIEKRSHIAGNIYTEKTHGINVHRYGAHIFHTNDRNIWDYVNQFADFNRFTNSPVANYRGELYSLPFNMYTFNKLWGVRTPDEAAAIIEAQRREAFSKGDGPAPADPVSSADAAHARALTGSELPVPSNLEEQAISLVGTDIYEKLVKGYTQKQWGRPCTELPAFIIRRLPVRFTYDNNYFNAAYQGIPTGGYTRMVKRMLEGTEVLLNTDYLDPAVKEKYSSIADRVIYTGPIDAYFDYRLGALEYRSVRFETEHLDTDNYQGNAVVNYTDPETPYTRIIEHKWFEFGKDEDGRDIPGTVISREFSSEWTPGGEAFYPVNDEKNTALFNEYRKLADSETNVIFGGRLAEYKYYDMDVVISAALNAVRDLLSR